MKTIKEALFDTVHKGEKPLKAIADEIDISPNYLYRAVTPDSEESDTGTGCKFPLKKLVPLVRATGDFQVLDVIEHTLGRCGVLLTPLSKTPSAYRSSMTISAIGNLADLLKGVEQAMKDRTITGAERETIRDKGYLAIESILQLMAAWGVKL